MELPRFKVWDKKRKEYVEDKVGGYAGPGFCISSDGELIIVGSLGWCSVEDKDRYRVKFINYKKAD